MTEMIFFQIKKNDKKTEKLGSETNSKRHQSLGDFIHFCNISFLFEFRFKFVCFVDFYAETFESNPLSIGSLSLNYR